MDVYTHEKEQIEEIKQWWKENRWYILSGLVISIAIVAGWRYWQDYSRDQAQAASQKYEQLLTRASVQDLAALETATRELQEDYASTPYASLGSMKLAAEYANAGDFDAAAEPLRWAMENTDDEQLALVARARLARVMLQLGQPAEALALLNGVDAGKFGALYDELRGDALLVNGDREGARSAYEAAMAALEPGLGDRRLLQMKVDNLAMPLEQLAPAPPSGNESEEE